MFQSRRRYHVARLKVRVAREVLQPRHLAMHACTVPRWLCMVLYTTSSHSSGVARLAPSAGCDTQNPSHSSLLPNKIVLGVQDKLHR